MVGRLVRGVQDFGASPADVTSVLFTHLHLDHVRGAVHSDDPTFPNAKHRAHSAEIAFSRSEAPTHAVRGDAEEPRRAIARLGASLVGFGEAEAVMPGVHAVTSAGHPPGHTVFRITSAGESLVCVGDTFYDRIQLRRPNFATPYDIDREASIKSRLRLLDQLAEEGVPIHAYHMPFPGLGRIVRSGSAFSWAPADAADAASGGDHTVAAARTSYD